jgi:hypothetical protein
LAKETGMAGIVMLLTKTGESGRLGKNHQAQNRENEQRSPRKEQVPCHVGSLYQKNINDNEVVKMTEVIF